MLDFELLHTEPLKYWMLLTSVPVSQTRTEALDLKQAFIYFTVTERFVLNFVDTMFSFSCKKEAKFKWVLGFAAVHSYFGHDGSL